MTASSFYGLDRSIAAELLFLQCEIALEFGNTKHTGLRDVIDRPFVLMS
jgi:hypothetical protein